MKLRLTACALAALGLFFAAGSHAALVRVGRIVVRADGGFEPRALPRLHFVPISFQGHADVAATDDGPVPPLRQIRIDFDHDGRLATRGLPVCPPSRIEGVSPATARRVCGAALVGTGHVEAMISLPGGRPVEDRSPLSFFNGPRVNGNPTLVSHAQGTFPRRETYVVIAEVDPALGRMTVEIPPIADGYGALTHLDGKISRRYRSGGRERSYVSARCVDRVFETRGRLTFVDGTIIEGTVYKACTIRG